MQNNEFRVDTILEKMNIESLNEIQEATLDATIEHKSLLLLSPTGSGKTLAFLLPLLQNLDKTIKTTQALILVPSRELAIQIETVFKTLGTGFKIASCYGGHKREIEENNLIQPPAVIVGTPGRLADHMRRNNITTDSIQFLILDEFDKSLEMGFLEEVKFVIESLPAVDKNILTSATQAVEIPAFMKLPDLKTISFLTGEEEKTSALAIQQIHSDDKDKLETLFKLLCHLGNRSTIIFCNHREAVERTSEFLASQSIVNTFYHGAMEQRDREVALAKFRNGSINFLVTTDLAARGLDIPNIRYIIHYHLPGSQEIFTHRNGRTARMDASGTAILILNDEERLPEYITGPVETITLKGELILPEKPKWATIFIGAGKKDKVNKVDIVGFLSNRGELKKEDIGLIEVKDFFSFAAIRKSSTSHALQSIKDHKLKNKKIRIDIAK